MYRSFKMTETDNKNFQEATKISKDIAQLTTGI